MMRTHTLFPAVAAVVGVMIAGAAHADIAAAKATVDAAKLDGVVGEQSDGYLGFVKGGSDAIKGEHAPPKAQAINLTWLEVITRKINRPLPLPSGTKVDLTLDTSTNLDQLLTDFAEYQRLRGSGPVQP